MNPTPKTARRMRTNDRCKNDNLVGEPGYQRTPLGGWCCRRDIVTRLRVLFSSVGLRTVCLLLGLTLAAPCASSAAEYFVDQEAGDDANDGSQGAPFKTINKGVLSAQAGDTVHVNPTGEPYRETIDLYEMKSGEPGLPITLDGHGVTISGAERCSPEGWRPWKDGVVVRDDHPWKPAATSSARFRVVFVIDGRLSLETTALDVLAPGEFCFLPNDSNRLFYRMENGEVPEVEVGQPDGSSVRLDGKAWQPGGLKSIVRYNGLQAPTWLKCNGAEVPLVTAIDRLEPGQFTVAGNELYFRLPPGRTIEDLAFEAVVRDNGVQIGGGLSDVIVRNFNVTRVANDGYNIHGQGKRLSFLNCNATQCGDEGFSAHGTAETLIDGAVFTDCDNGINNTGQSENVARNVLIAGCRGQGFEGGADSRNTVENLVLIDNPNQLSCPNITGKNIFIANVHRDSARTIAASGLLERVTLVGATSGRRLLEVGAGRKLTLTGSRFERAGTVHIRDHDPSNLIVNDSLFHPDTILEWGPAEPFEAVRLTEAATGQSPALPGAGFIDEPVLGALLAGDKPQEVPAGPGCTPELIERFRSFMATDKTPMPQP